MAPPSNRRPGFSRRAQYGLFFTYVGTICGALIGVVLLLVSLFNPPAFAALRRTVAEVTTPVSSALAWASDGVSSVPTAIGSYFAVHSENARLKKQIAAEQQSVSRAQTLIRENGKLRGLLKLRDVGAQIIVTARLVNSSATSTRRYATLNAGTWQGVRPGQPVREASGLIGQVVEAGPNTARVLLIVDAESIVPVRRTRDGLPAIAAGRGDGMIEIRSAGAAAMIFRPGDAFVTSGTGGIFPPDVPVAHVVKPGRDIAVAEPAANPSTLDFAIVQPSFLPPPPPPPPAPTPSSTPTPTSTSAAQ